MGWNEYGKAAADVSLSVSFHTLGCKLNQAETESLAAAFDAAGFTVKPWDQWKSADLLVINTCTVTSKAEQKARRILRLVLRETEAPLVVTGCYAQLEAEKLAALAIRPGLFIIPGRKKDALLGLPAFLAESHAPVKESIERWLSGAYHAGSAGVFSFTGEASFFHARAFLKIQDGCDKQCAYCRVPLARGPSQSLASIELLRRLKTLESAGTAEAVLSGINITQYNCPESGKKLGELLIFLLENTGSIALRLSSIEPGPGDFSPAFLEAVSHKRLRPHFHLSVQSGSAEVLRAMGRSYGPDAVRESAALLRKIKGDPFLACDMISGFPGETDEDFEQSYALAGTLDLAWIHAFPYSPRPGTPAFSLKNRISERESARRLERLLELSRRGRTAYIERWTGRIVDAVRIAPRTDNSGQKPRTNEALTANYLKLALPPENPGTAGNALRCRIIRPDATGAFDAEGEPC